MKEDTLLLGMAEDKIEQCETRGYATCTGFLDSHQQSVLRTALRRRGASCRIEFTGGYEDAERVIMICLPEWMDLDPSQFFSVIRAQIPGAHGANKLTHRDYLGSLLSIGIKRDVTGDILVREDGADIIVLSEMAEFILQNYTSAGRQELSVSLHPITSLILPVRLVHVIKDTVASLRLDNVISAGFQISRGNAAAAITGGLVFVNHIESLKPDKAIREGDLITLRHRGRIQITEIGDRSRKDRIRITIEKY